MPKFNVEIRSAQFKRIGKFEQYNRMEAIVRYCDVGTWSMDVDASLPEAKLLVEGGGIIVWAEGLDDPLFSGPLKTISRKWDNSNPGELITFTGMTDELWLNERVIYPLPTALIGAQTIDRQTGAMKAAVAMGYLVRRNLGPDALADRIHPYVTVDNLDEGPVINLSARFDVLGEYLQKIALSTGYGYQMIHNEANVRFRIFQPANRSSTVVFSPELGNLAEYGYKLSAPDAMKIIVASQGEGKDRYLKMYTAPDADLDWSSFAPERFVDRRDIPIKRSATGLPVDPTTNAAVTAAVLLELDQAGAEAVLEASGTASLSVTPIDTETIRFGRDYQLGDIVSVSIGGVSLTDVLREVRLIDSIGEGARVHPVVGTADASETPYLYKKIKQLETAIKRLEARF